MSEMDRIFWPFFDGPIFALLNFENMKKAPRDVIILHVCAKNHKITII